MKDECCHLCSYPVRNPEGFSLIEIIIALAIIGSVLTVLIYTVNHHAEISYDNAVTTHMYQLAKEKLQEMELNPRDSQGTLDSGKYSYMTTVSESAVTGIVEISSVIRNNRREVALKEFIRSK